MILMNGATLDWKQVFRPESQQLTLGEKDSNSVLTVGPDAPVIAVGDWMIDDEAPGKDIVWRVKGVDTSYNDGARTITLEHIIQTLNDSVIFGEISTAMISGGATATAQQAIQYALSRQTLWTLGSFGYSGISAPYEFNGDSVMDAIESVCSTLPDCVWTYDLSATPFKLNIMPRGTTVSCEMRGGRNLSTIRKSIDRSRMYTRIYPVGADDLHLASEYIEMNTALYGVISKVETDQAHDTEEKLRIWATDRLQRHCEPTVTISINGLELSQETGEPMDHLTIGTVCRVPMPELGTTMEERITRIVWKDKIRDPHDVTVTLANNREDVATIYKNEKKSTDKSKRTGAKLGKKTNGKIEDTAAGIYSQIDQTASKIELLVKNTANELKGSIKVQADRISLVVEGTGPNAYIKPASIVSAINDNRSSIKISANQITLDGRTTISSLLTGQAHVSKLMVNDLQVQAQGGMGYLPVTSCINTATVTGNQLKLYRMNGQLAATFNRATSLSGRWSGTGQGTVAEFECAADDKSVPALATWISLSASGSTVYAKDPSGITRASLSTSSYTYTLFGRFSRYGTVSVEGQTYMAYITQDTDASATNLALYRRN